jgi:predicted hydrocarbon binding protein
MECLIYLLKETVRLFSTLEESKAEELYELLGEKLGENFGYKLLKFNFFPEKNVESLKILAFQNEAGYFEFFLENGSKLMKVKFKGSIPCSQCSFIKGFILGTVSLLNHRSKIISSRCRLQKQGFCYFYLKI